MYLIQIWIIKSFKKKLLLCHVIIGITISPPTFAQNSNNEWLQGYEYTAAGKVTHHQNLYDTQNYADYLIITTEQFKQNDDLMVLAQHRAEFDSFDVAVVTTNEIYQQFPETEKYTSIKSYLTYVHDNWATPHIGDGHLSYVLIVGEGAKNSTSYIPTYYYEMLSDSVASDLWYACLNDDNGDGRIDKFDNIPDLIIGRFSVETNSELKAIVAKTVSYDNELMVNSDWQKKISLVSAFTLQDESIFITNLYDEINEFARHQNYFEISDVLQRSRMELENVHDLFIDAVNNGRGIINVNAHGALQSWGDGQGWHLFTTEEMPLLKNDHQFPIIFNFSCNAGKFNDPEKDCLAEILLNTPQKGAVAYWGSTVSSKGGYHFNRELFNSLMQNNNLSLGLYLYVTQLSISSEKGYILLGDPALNLKSKTIHDLADLFITSDNINLIWTPYENEDDKIKITLHNNGFTNAHDVIVKLCDNNPQSGGKQLVPDITVREIVCLGGNVTIEIPTADKGNNFSVYVKVDPDNHIPEYNESNNEAFAVFRESLFVDFNHYASLGNINHGTLPLWGDYNNDGYLDLFIANSGENSKLFQNLGNGKFTEYTRGLSIATPERIVNAVFVDIDNNKFLDIFMENTPPSEQTVLLNPGQDEIIHGSFAIGVGAVLNEPVFGFFDYNNDGFLDILCNNLLSNNGDGTFSDISNKAFGSFVPGFGHAAFGDYDNDGDCDLLLLGVLNSFLYRNNGDSTFSDVTESAGLAYLNNGINATFTDYDNDGDLDFLLIRQRFLPSLLFQNNGEGTFTDITQTSGININVKGAIGLFFDYDNDGYQDLYIRKGNEIGSIFRNNGNRTFQIDSTAFSNRLLQTFTGIALGDFDNDGDVDLYGTTFFSSQKNVLLINRGNDNNWLTVNLRGIKSNSFGIGARVKIVIDNTVQIREVNCIFKDRVQMSLPAHFGLGTHNHIDTLIVRWPSGIIDNLTSVPINSVLTVEEGYGDISIPNTSNLFQNYPNPFNSMTTIRYTVKGDPHHGRSLKHVNLSMFNILGQKIKTLVDDQKISNSYSIHWDGTNNTGNFVTSGIYFYQLKIDDQVETKKILLVR